MIYYKDQDIVIRDITEEDIRDLFMCWIDRDLNKYDPRPMPMTGKELIDECINYCNRFEEEVINEHIDDRKYKYFIITDHNDGFIGYVNFFSIDIIKKQGEMGIVIGNKRYFRKGIAFRAVKAAMDYIFSKMDIERIYIETAENNIPALNLFNKLGFNNCGLITDEDYKFVLMEKHKNNDN